MIRADGTVISWIVYGTLCGWSNGAAKHVHDRLARSERHRNKIAPHQKKFKWGESIWASHFRHTTFWEQLVWYANVALGKRCGVDGLFGWAHFSAVSTKGKWRAVDGQRRIFELTWPEPVDSVTLSADGSHISGKNQYGVAISGVRTEPCAGN